MLAQRIRLGMLLTSLLVCTYEPAHADSLQRAAHVYQSVKRVGIDSPNPETYVRKLGAQLISKWVGKPIEFFDPISPEREIMAEKSSQNQRYAGERPGMGSGKVIDSEHERWQAYLLPILSIAVGIIGLLLLNAFRRGVNKEWRALMFSLEFRLGLPIPRWLYFVPKHEQSD
jgi:hypothetical protein